ncbi:ABC transporter substrate-binding protein [Plantactinospora sp. BC1]|uniref:ABC transporter substrate-binding protein n=1 Tax=Plantactinospora sp. BC1 TaxID=2108470 RepID=UPI001F22D667|nr:ABC transporter substrate-binding protein [Plantactinospora sp. BC1]
MIRIRPTVRRFVAVAAAGGLLAVASCSSSTAPGASTAAGDTFVVATGGEPDTLNPVLNYGVDGASLIFDGLVARDAQNRLVPGLATELPTVSTDGRTVTAKLRDGVLFHDGTALTAADVVFTYRTVLDPKVDSTLRSDLEMLASVEAPDPATVVFRLKYAYAPFLQRLTLGIVPAKALDGQDVNKAGFNRKPVGTGPYQVESWTPGDRLVLTANDRYFAGKPTNRRLVVAFVADDNIRAQRMRAGEFDVAELAPKLAAGFDGGAGYRVERVPTADYRGVMLPMGNPVTADPAIRRALNLAVDRAAMVTGVLGGAGEPAHGPVPPTSEFAEPAVVGKPTADPAAATALLDAAGWTPGAGGIRARDGRPARFTLMYPASDSLRKELALAVTADARKVGIEITPAGLTWDAIDPRLNSDALIMGYGTPYDPDFVSYKLFGSRFAGQGYFNPGHYKSTVVDQALQQGRDQSDPARRKQAYSTFQKQLAADVPWVYLTYLKHTYVLRDSIDGVSPRVEAHEHDVANSLWWNINTWTRR